MPKDESEMLSEVEIKAKILEKLLRDGKIQKESLIFNEMNLSGKARRLDLAYITRGEMVAIEVKSEKDSLSRLSGQLDEYLKYFDRVVVVAASRFTNEIISLAHSEVEVLEISGDEFKTIRRGRKIKAISKESYLSLMTKREVSILARMAGIKAGNLPMYDLKVEVMKKMRTLSKERIKGVLIEGLTKRFALPSNRFLLKVYDSKQVSAADVPLLSPYLLMQSA